MQNYPVTLVVFGATGDLAERKLFPALFGLYQKKLLPAHFKIVAFARRPFTDQSFRELMKPNIMPTHDHSHGAEGAGHSAVEEDVGAFLSHVVYHQGLFEELKPYISLISLLGEIDKELGACSHKIFHLALSPFFYETVLKNLEASALNLSCTDGTGVTRLLIEKPIGADLASARRINALLAEEFKEEQIFRVDHYLMKNALYDLATLRFNDDALQTIWNSDAVESIELSLYENITAAGRGAFYDKTGAFRDIGQNHLLETLALLLAEKVPGESDRDKRIYRAEALKELEGAKFETSSADSLYRGQYENYVREEGVATDSQTETFFRLPFVIESGRWKGLKVTLKGGKALDRSEVSASIVFRQPVSASHFSKQIGGEMADDTGVFDSHASVPEHGHNDSHAASRNSSGAFPSEISKMVLVVQPNPSVEYHFDGGRKKIVSYQAGKMEKVSKGEKQSDKSRIDTNRKNRPDNYERVYFDALAMDQSRFVSKNETEAAWSFTDRALNALRKAPLAVYEQGSDPDAR